MQSLVRLIFFLTWPDFVNIFRSGFIFLLDGNSGELKQMVSKGQPIGRSPQIQLRNMHATYIATW